MADIVFGLATSRSGMISMPVDLWPLMAERDKRRRLRNRNGDLVTYDEMLANAPASMAAEVTPEVFQQKYDAAQAAFATLVKRYAEIDPDYVLVMGDDEEEYIHDDNRPAIMLYRGETWRNIPRAVTESTDPVGVASNWSWGREDRSYPVAAGLTERVLRYLIEAEFDVGDSLTLKAMAHGFGFMYERIMHRVVPIIPVVVNVHTPPAQPTPKRCYDLGRAVRDALLASGVPGRVAVVATGGLSVGFLDEELDRRLLGALQQRDVQTIAGLPRGWIQGSTGEVLNWVGAGGAAEHLTMEPVNYTPAYRSPAGTGTGLGFAMWT